MYAVRSGVHQSRKSPDHTTPVLTFHHARRYSSLILSKGQRQALFQRIPVFLHRQYSDGTSDAGCQVLQLSADIYAGHAGKCAGSLPVALQSCAVLLKITTTRSHPFANARIIGTESDNPPSKYV